MPYILKSEREQIDPLLDALLDHEFDFAIDEGVMNYIVTRMMHAFIGPVPRYAKFNAAVGILECAKLELYRHHVAPYEDTKIAANGDVP